MLAGITWHWIAIIVSIVWMMAYGGVVFARPVLGNWWMKQVGIDPANVDQKAAMRGLGLAFLMTAIASVLFSALWSWTGATGVGDGWMVGLVVGLAAAGTASFVHPVFEGRPTGVAVLYLAYHVVEWIGIGIVFGLLA